MIEGIIVSLATTALIGIAVAVRKRVDRVSVVRWLRAKTRDEPGESHLPLHLIAKGLSISEARVVEACISDPRIFRSQQSPELWSVWRAEPQSVYEKRGLLFV